MTTERTAFIEFIVCLGLMVVLGFIIGVSV